MFYYLCLHFKYKVTYVCKHYKPECLWWGPCPCNPTSIFLILFRKLKPVSCPQHVKARCAGKGFSGKLWCDPDGRYESTPGKRDEESPDLWGWRHEVNFTDMSKDQQATTVWGTKMKLRGLNQKKRAGIVSDLCCTDISYVVNQQIRTGLCGLNHLCSQAM